MRIPLPLPLVALLTACSSNPELSSEPLDRCESTDCFNQQLVRDYEIIGNTSMIVYVGPQRCAFLVEFTGQACDLTFFPGGELTFKQDYMRAARDPNFLLTRVCASDSNLGIDEGPFTTAAGADNIEPRIPCRIRDIVSMTDDEVLELYVDRQIAAPPPPFGTGEISVPEESAESEGAADPSADPSPDDAPESASTPTPAERSAGPTG